MNKKVLGSRKREGLLFLERILVVVMAVSMTLAFMNSFLSVPSLVGNLHFELSPFEREKAFEEKQVFHDTLYTNMNQIFSYVEYRHQMEKNGVYDGKKVIDITEFTNHEEVMLNKQVTAQYYLDDLIKWGNYGFTYKTVIGTWDELNYLFADNTATYLKGNLQGLQEYEGTREESYKEWGTEALEGDQYAMEILVPRYKTVDGKDLLACASNIEEYEELKANLINTASALSSNYKASASMAENYGMNKTNILYCFQVQANGGLVYYTNTDIDFRGKSVDDITAIVKEQGGKFIYFNPDKVQISTNTSFTAMELRNLLKQHEYIYGDNTRVWIWVDTAYPAQDTLQSVKGELDRAMPYFWGMTGCAAGALAFILLIVVYLSFKEGRVLNEEEISYSITRQDTFPLEVWAVLTIILEMFFLRCGWQLLSAYRSGTINYPWLPAVIGLLLFFMNEVFLRFYFSMVRRIKAKEVWKTTLLYLMGRKGKTFFIRTYNEGSLVSRTWIPYLIFLMVNLIMVLLGVGGVVGAFMLDMLVGVYLYRENKARNEIVEGIEIIKNGEVKHQIDTANLHGDNLKLANSVNSIGIGIRKAVESSMKDEKLKTDLITNVSHDIKTPLTSIITYVDLLKRENISDPKIAGYLEVLDTKSQRLKQLIDDLVEASKISSGNINIQMETINFVELVRQAMGEFCEKFDEKQLKVVSRLPDSPVLIKADSSQLWRVMENLFQNISKYALTGTRVYVEMEESEEGKIRKSIFSAKNISAGVLDVNAEDLTERFIRGDESRQTEGSGLGLSIAKNLIEAQGGEFEIQVDGDLFKVIISFPVAEENR